MEPEYQPIVNTLLLAIQELKNPSGNVYHAKTLIIIALNTIQIYTPEE
jgi:hypothetical protein